MMELTPLEIFVDFTTILNLQRIRCVVNAEEDSRGIEGRWTKNGTRPLRIVMTTREMVSRIYMEIVVQHILCPGSLIVPLSTTPTLPLLKCVVLAEAEIREFARTRTTEPRTVTDILV